MSDVTVTLNDACEFIVDCLHATAPIQDEGYPLIRTPNIGKGRLKLDGAYRVSEDTYNEWTRRAVPEKDDLILAREAPAGNVAIVKNGQQVCLGQRTVHLRPDKSKVDPDFLCYYLLAPPQQGALLAGETGATAKHVNMKDIRRLPLKGMPHLSSQHKIGAILCAYDHLIENNRRRIQLLEQSARLLYKEWFVHLRFPGHEHVKIKDGVPEGWEKLTYSDVFEFLGGFAFKSKIYQEVGKYGIVSIKNVHDASFVSECSAFLDAPPEKMKEYCLLKTGDVLLSLTGNVGRACVVYGENYLLNQRVAKIVGKPGIPRSFVYWTFSNDDTQKQLENLSFGVAQLNLSPVKLGSREFIKPSQTILNLFSEIAEPILQQITALNLQIEQLAKARDLLLPRLMNGEVAV